MQVFGRDKEVCADYMLKGLMTTLPDENTVKKKFYIVDQYGIPTGTKTSIHDQAKDFIWQKTSELLQKWWN